jgi:microfibrillar-associated protein 1
MQKVKVHRYISGKRPDYAPDTSSEEGSDEEEFIQTQRTKRSAVRVFLNVLLTFHIPNLNAYRSKEEDVEKVSFVQDKRLERLQRNEDEKSSEEEDNEDDIAARRLRRR